MHFPLPKAELQATGSYCGDSKIKKLARCNRTVTRLKTPSEHEFKWDGYFHYSAHHDLVLTDGEMRMMGAKPVVSRDLHEKPAARINSLTVAYFDPSAMEGELQAEFGGNDTQPDIYSKDLERGATRCKLGNIMADQSSANVVR
ncbi:hypothetical protein [Rhizobium skierniewicense]|uniref:hypothetical protein n=1 Tax=Rhizobium skierniewicense TaxID=984260 RepID=UPI001AEEBCC6|nr:hypothetical protein [Rhizobium skierniewicense]NTF34461.1 hypothetical protein [Rhizobium skierniewicense]